MWNQSLWSKTVDYTSRIVLVTRCGERVDRVFSSCWQNTEVTQLGQYRPTDLNLPATMPALAFSDLDNDSPLTACGKFEARLMARALELRDAALIRIISSPALNAVQTAYAFAQHFKMQIVVEPGLCEPRQWYNGQMPRLLMLNELIACGYPTELGDEPIYTDMNDMRHEKKKTTQDRIRSVLRQLDQSPRSDLLLIVAHGFVVDVALKMCGDGVSCFMSLPSAAMDLLMLLVNG